MPRRTHPNAPRSTSLASSAAFQPAGRRHALGRWPALWRTGALMLIAGIVFAPYMVLILILNVK